MYKKTNTKSPTYIEPLMCSLLRTDPEDGPNPHRPMTRRLLALNFSRVEASAIQPNPALLAKILKSRFPDIISISPHKLKSTLLLEVDDDHTCDSLLAITELDGTSVSIRRTYNDTETSKASFECEMLSHYTETELYRILQNQGVIEVYQKVRTLDGQKLSTNTYVLTFDTPEPPKRVFIDSLSINVEVHVPKPRLCFNCQWYGHVRGECNRETICARCSKKGHDYQSCQETPFCIHCKQNHPSSDRKCPMYILEKLILDRKFRTKSTFQEARKYIYSAHPDLTNQIPRLRGPTSLQRSSAAQADRGMTYSQATSPKEPEIKKAAQEMIEALILTVEKQQEQIALLISELTNMKSRFETLTQTTTAAESYPETQTKPHNNEMETQTHPCQTETKDTATQTEERIHNAETQTPFFDPSTPFSPSSLSFLTESKVDETLALETSRLNESEANEFMESANKRKCISPIECPRQGDLSLSPCTGIDNTVVSEELYGEDLDESSENHDDRKDRKESKDTCHGYQNKDPRNRIFSDSAVDYHDLNAPEKRDPEESSSQSNDQDTDSTEGNQEHSFCVVQAFFSCKELAQKMNATEIKEAVNQHHKGPIVCSILRLENTHGGHFIYLHSTPNWLPLPCNFEMLPDTKVILEKPRKKINKWCDCPEVAVFTDDKIIIYTNPIH